MNLAAGLFGIMLGAALVLAFYWWWHNYGIRVTVCRRKGHEYSRPDKPYITAGGPREGWSWDPKYCWREAKMLPEAEWDPQREEIWRKRDPWLYEGPLVP